MVNKVFTCQDRRGKRRSGGVRVQSLDHPQTPIACSAGVGSVVAHIHSRRAVPGDVDASIIAGGYPREDVIVQSSCQRAGGVYLHGR
jgi:hypothetical protein